MGRIDDRGHVRPGRQVHRVSAVRLARGGKAEGRAAGYFHERVLQERTSIAGGNGSAEGSLRRRGRAGELEGADARVPEEGAVCCIVLVAIPEGGVVARIQAHRAVIAPTIARPGLHARAGEHERFTLRQRIGRVGGETARISDRWKSQRGNHAGGAVADRQISGVIERGAAHPTLGCIRRKGRLIEHRVGAAGSGFLQHIVTCRRAIFRHRGIYTWRRDRAAIDCVTGREQFRSAPIEILQTEHQTVANAVQIVGCDCWRGFFDIAASSGITRIERGHRKGTLGALEEGRVRRDSKVRVEIEEPQRIGRITREGVVGKNGENVGSAGGRWRQAIIIRRDHARGGIA